MSASLYSAKPLDLRRRHFINSYPPFNVARSVEDPLAPPRRDLLLYVHIPFCPTICTYCFFRKFGNPSESVLDTYVRYLKREIAIFASRPEVSATRVRTLYVGGGTPSVLSGAQLADIVSFLRAHLDFSGLEEFCCEIMPHEPTATPEKLALLKELGVTRLSFGVETFDEDLLRRHNRPCTRDLYDRTYATACDVGFEKINVDVMSGLAGATTETWAKDVAALLSWRPPSVSIYKIEFFYNTLAFTAMRNGATRQAVMTDEEEIEHVRYAHDVLCRDGGYVVANCLQLLEAWHYNDVHYRSIWEGGELKGLGLSAHSAYENVLHQNTSELDEYYAMLDAGRLPIKRAYRLTTRDRMSRAMVYGLKNLAVHRPRFASEFGMDLTVPYGPLIQELVDAGAVIVDDEHLRITPPFYIFADDICRQFFLPEYDRMMPAHVDRSAFAVQPA